MRHRPIGIGVQGLADTFMLMDMPFSCDDARQLNKDIFETIYHAALEQSCELAISEGKYETFDGTPASEGILQFDMWNVTPSSRYNSDQRETKGYTTRFTKFVVGSTYANCVHVTNPWIQ